MLLRVSEAIVLCAVRAKVRPCRVRSAVVLGLLSKPYFGMERHGLEWAELSPLPITT